MKNRIFFLTLAFFLNPVVGADGFPDHIRPNSIEIEMEDGSIFEGRIRGFGNNRIPIWLKPRQSRPSNYQAFLRTARKNQFLASEITGIDVKPNYCPSEHGPKNIFARIDDDNYFSARSFQTYDVEQYQHNEISSDFPLKDYIYLTVPGGYAYSSILDNLEERFSACIPVNGRCFPLFVYKNNRL